MTARTLHIVAISLIVAAIVAGGVSWVLDGLAFWIVVGTAAVLILSGLVLAGRASAGQKEGDKPKR